MISQSEVVALVSILLVAVGIARAQESDCDGNGIFDSIEIEEGLADDCDGNGILDSCELVKDLRFGGSNFTANEPLVELKLGDLNGDDVLDLVGTSRDSELLVLLGSANGTFSSAESHEIEGDLPDGLDHLLVMDVTGDERIDVVVAVRGRLIVFRGGGDGSLEILQTLEIGSRFLSLLAGDLDSDGDTDLIVLSSAGLLLYRGLEGGRFADEETNTELRSVRAAKIADLNDDGFQDLLISRENLRWYPGFGGGVLGPSREISRVSARVLELFDLDGDGDLDIMAGIDETNDVAIFRAEEGGQFRASGFHRVGFDPLKIFVKDPDSGENPEIVVVGRGGGPNRLPGTLSVLRSGSDGAFADVSVASISSDFVRSVDFGDIDGDGFFDLVITEDSVAGFGRVLGTASGEFETIVTTKFLGRPRHIVAGDFDEDGWNDLIVAGATDGASLWFARGNGQGQFPSMTRRSLGEALGGIKVSDLNRDGHLDLVLVDSDEDELLVLTGVGDGSFSEATRYAIGEEPIAITFLDADGDGDQDLAIAYLNLQEISVQLNEGSGRFTTPSYYSIEGWPRALTTLRLAGDSFDDLAALLAGGRIAILAGREDGSMTPGETVSVGEWELGLNPADVDLIATDVTGDGLDDILACGGAAGEISILEATDVGFELSTLQARIGEVNRLVAADFNSDGRNDLLAVNRDGGYASLLENISDPGSIQEQRLSIGSRAYSVVSADFNQDGQPDIAVSLLVYPQQIVTVLNRSTSDRDCDGNGKIDECEILAGEASDDNDDGVPDACQIALHPRLDCDGNGFEDAVEIERGESEDCDSSGIPDECELATRLDQRRVDYWTTRISRLLAVDLDTDGNDDIVVEGEDQFYSLRRLEDGSFAAAVPFAVGVPVGAFVLRDLDGDGEVDLASVNIEMQSLRVTFGSPGGKFVDPIALDLSGLDGGRGRGAISMIAADIDGDHDLDLIVANHWAASVFIARVTESRTFELVGEFSLPFGSSRPVSMATADLDGDGIHDFVTANTGDDSVSIVFGQEDGSIEGFVLACPESPRTIGIADFDEDGVPDVVVTTRRGVCFFLGAGERSFIDGGFIETHREVSGVPFGDRLVAADLDADGHVDVAFANPREARVTMLLGRGDVSFQALSFDVAPSPFSLVTLIRKGRLVPDLLVALQADGVSVLTLEVERPVHEDCDLDRIPDVCRLKLDPAADANGDGVLDVCEPHLQVPGDCNQDGILNIADPLCLLGVLFVGEPDKFPCGDGSGREESNLSLLDSQLDGVINLADAIYPLRFLMLGGPAMPLAVAGEETSGCVDIEGCPTVAACD